MALMMGDLRAALVEAGSTPELADKAAREVAAHQGRVASIDSRLSVLIWMAGASLAMTLLAFGSLVGLWTKAGGMTGAMTHLH